MSSAAGSFWLVCREGSRKNRMDRSACDTGQPGVSAQRVISGMSVLGVEPKEPSDPVVPDVQLAISVELKAGLDRNSRRKRTPLSAQSRRTDLGQGQDRPFFGGSVER